MDERMAEMSVLGVLLDDVLLRRGVYMCIGQLLLSCHSRLSGTDWQHRITGLRAPHLTIFFQRRLATRRSWKSEHPTIHRMIHFSTWKMFKASLSLQQLQSGQIFVVVAVFYISFTWSMFPGSPGWLLDRSLIKYTLNDGRQQPGSLCFK